MWLEDQNEKRKQAIMNYSSGEDSFEFLNDQETISFTVSQGRYKTKIRKLAEQYPDECQILFENKDGSIFGHFPTRWLKISANKVEVSEETKERGKQNLKRYRENKENS